MKMSVFVPHRFVIASSADGRRSPDTLNNAPPRQMGPCQASRDSDQHRALRRLVGREAEANAVLREHEIAGRLAPQRALHHCTVTQG